jgi:hypothetical protein
MRELTLSKLSGWAFALVWTLALGGELRGQSVDTSVRLAISVSPNLSAPGRTGGVLVTLTNRNPLSDQQFQTNDAFLLQFDLDDGSV